MNRPIKKELTVIYWDCGRDGHGHRHRTEAVAQHCLNRRLNNEAVLRSKFQNEEAVMRVLNGERASKVAKLYGTTKGRLDSAVLRYVEKHPGYSWEKYIEIFREPGVGPVTAAVILHEKLVTQ
jgi:hypothetical protein